MSERLIIKEDEYYKVSGKLLVLFNGLINVPRNVQFQEITFKIGYIQAVLEQTENLIQKL